MPYNKQQYIERFGEDYYYNVVVPRQREAARKYRNTEKGKETKHRYNTIGNGRTSWMKYAASEHGKEMKSKKQKRYLSTKEGKAMQLKNRYVALDRKKGFDVSNNADDSYILENIINSKCIYCGDSDWTHLGCDRIDNSKPHTEDNIVCSCGICNSERQGKRMSVEEFVEYRKTHPRVLSFKLPQQIVEINGVRVIKKVG